MTIAMARRTLSPNAAAENDRLRDNHQQGRSLSRSIFLSLVGSVLDRKRKITPACWYQAA